MRLVFKRLNLYAPANLPVCQCVSHYLHDPRHSALFVVGKEWAVGHRRPTWIKGLLLALLFILFDLPIAAQTANKSAPVHNVDGSFVREFLVLGPFPSKDIEMDFLADVGGEANIRPKEGDSLTTSDGKRLIWTRLNSNHDMVNFEQVFGIQEWSVAYAYCELDSDRAGESDVRAFANRATLAWFNGKSLGSIPLGIGASIDILPVLPVQLEAGRNACLLKLSIGVSEWQFMFQPLPPARGIADLRVTDPAGGNIAGALVQFYDRGKLTGRLTTDASGKARASLYPLAQVYDVRVTSGEMGTWLFDVVVPPGERRRIDVQLANALSVAGQVLAMDRSPQNAIVVQAIHIPDSSNSGRADLPVRPKLPQNEQGESLVSRTEETPTLLRSQGMRSMHRGSDALPQESLPVSHDFTAAQQRSPTRDTQIQSLLPMPAFSETTLTDTNGLFRFVNLRPGKYWLRCHGPGGYVYLADEDEPDTSELITVESGQTREGLTFVLPEVKKGVWKNFHINKGLTELNPVSVHQTPDGMLWFGTSQAILHTYDGVEFKVFPSELPGTQAVIEHDASGRLWVGAGGGAGRRINGRIQALPFGDDLLRPIVNAIHPDADGTVWFGTGSGLRKYDGTNIVRLSLSDGLPSHNILSLLRATDGALWMGTGNGLARLNEEGFMAIQTFHGFSNRTVGMKLHQTRDEAIWFCTFDGAYRYDGETILRLGVEDGLQSDTILDIAETSDGVLWFGTYEGLSRLSGRTVLNYTEKDGLSSHGVHEIFVDSDDVLWCANGYGVSRFDPEGFVGITSRDGFKNGSGNTAGVFAIEPDLDGSCLIGTEWGGVYRIGGKGNSLSIESVYPSAGYVRQIHRAIDGTLWFGTFSGIFKIENERIVKVLERAIVVALNSDDQGNLWFGHGWNRGGLSRYNPKTGLETVFTQVQGLPDDHVWAIERSDDGGVWVGSGAGLALFQGGKIEGYGEKLGMPSGTVFNLRRDAEHTLWIGSGEGLHRLEPLAKPAPNISPTSGRAAVLRRPDITAERQLSPTVRRDDTLLEGFKHVSITATNGLPDEFIWCSARTSDGIIWIGTNNNGLLGYDGKAVTVIDMRDGLQGNSVSALAPDVNDSLLVGFLDGGLTRYQPTKTPPSVRLIEVQLANRKLTDFSNFSETEIGDRITVRYQEIDLKTHPDKRQFCYRVTDPFGETLFAATTKDRTFEWIPEEGGNYTFEVQSIDRDLNYSEPARLTFRATVPWYANAWITVPGGGTFVGLLIWAFLSRALYMGKRREAERLREQMLLQERHAREALEDSHRSLAEAKLAAENANHAKSSFLANMSHEIRTPLNAVLGFAQILLRDRRLENDQRQSVGTIERSGSHLLGIINEILDLSKIEAGAMDLAENDFDLRELVLGLSAMFEPRCREKRLEWRVEWENGSDSIGQRSEIGRGESGAMCEGENPQSKIQNPKSRIPIRSDEGKLRQVLINILGNAVKFTDTGTITLRVVGPTCRSALPSDALVDSKSQTRHSKSLTFSTFNFEIEDTGHGIPADVREKIFEPFSQAAEGQIKGGTGLGLAIARKQIALMGGELKLRSEPDAGSCFYFSLELAPASNELQILTNGNGAGKRVKRLKAGTTVRALIADDVVENRDVLNWLLEDLGAEVTLAEDGEEALLKLRTETFDIAFMDIRMPKMTGFQVVENLLSEADIKRAKLVAVSASVLVHEQRLYEEAGFDAFVPKPFRFEELVDCLKAQLGVGFEYEEEEELDSNQASHDASSPSIPGKAALPRSPDMAATQLDSPSSTIDQAKETSENFIDRKRFKELFRGDQVRLRKYMNSYLRHTSAQLAQLRDAVKVQDISEVELLAHRCRGASGNLGITVMAEVMEKIEETTISRDLSDTPQLLAEAEQAFEIVKELVENQ